MDLAFFRRAQRALADSSPAGLDYGVLVATLSAAQSTSPTARAEALCAGGGAVGAPGCHPLVEILRGGPGWREAVAARGGCFHPGAAASVKPL